VIAPIKGFNRMGLATTWSFAATAGKQKPEHFLGLEKDTLNIALGGGAPEQVGQTSTAKITNEEKLEINSIV
jgi:hypothetical protein